MRIRPKLGMHASHASPLSCGFVGGGGAIFFVVRFKQSRAATLRVVSMRWLPQYQQYYARFL